MKILRILVPALCLALAGPALAEKGGGMQGGMMGEGGHMMDQDQRRERMRDPSQHMDMQTMREHMQQMNQSMKNMPMKGDMGKRMDAMQNQMQQMQRHMEMMQQMMEQRYGEDED